MDEFNARLVSAIASVLRDVESDTAAERSALQRIARQLEELSAGFVDDICCERISRELEGAAAAKPQSRRLS